MKEALGLKRDGDLARALGVQPNLISTWRSRDHIDLEKIIQIGLAHGVDLNQLFSMETLRHATSWTTPIPTKDHLHHRVIELEGEVRGLRTALEIAMGKSDPLQLPPSGVPALSASTDSSTGGSEGNTDDEPQPALPVSA